jgi:hypothetical protein
MEWLNTKGIRENALEKALVKWKPYIVGGMEARLKVSEAAYIQTRYSFDRSTADNRIFLRKRGIWKDDEDEKAMTHEKIT